MSVQGGTNIMLNVLKVFAVALCSTITSSHAFAQTHDFTTYTEKPSFYDSLPAVKKGGTLYFEMMSDPKVINPLLSADADSASLESYLWLPLMTLDPQTLNYLPALATGYSISQDKKTYLFTLNPKAKWQDGTPVTADDFLFTFNTMMNTSTNSAALRSYYQGVTFSIKDPHTIVFTVADPKFDSLVQLASFVAIQKNQFKNSKNFNLDKGIMKPVGNGPYMLEKYERTQKIVFKRNKNWWGYSIPNLKNRYNIDEIVMRIIGDHNLAYEKFTSGALDMMGFTPEEWHIKVNGIDKNKFGNSNSSGKSIWALKEENQFPRVYDYVGWNEKNPIFNDVKTRRALSYLVNYKKIINNVDYNMYVQCTSPFGSFTKNSAQELRSAKNMITFNAVKARQLLKEAGWKNEGGDTLVKTINGKKIPFVFELLTVSTNKERVKIAQILKEDFESSGIQVNIKSMEWNSFLDRVDKRDFDAVILGWTSTLFPNPKQIWDSKSSELGGSNFISYSNPKVDQLIEKANVEFDPNKRNLIMQEINRLIYADQPYTFLTEPKYGLFGLNSKIKSKRWFAPYDSSLATDLFYLQ